jgi:hypothetical protein
LDGNRFTTTAISVYDIWLVPDKYSDYAVGKQEKGRGIPQKSGYLGQDRESRRNCPYVAPVAEARSCGTAATRREKTGSYCRASGDKLHLCCIDQKLLKLFLFLGFTNIPQYGIISKRHGKLHRYAVAASVK